MNAEEALKCVRLSKKHWVNGEREKAIKLARKSVTMYRCEETLAWLSEVDDSNTKPSNIEKEEPTAATYTKEQVDEVQKIKDCGDDLYAILDVNKEVDENGLKRAYKKKALQFHPDKNAAPGASEAFNAISDAYSILSDQSKRSVYDLHGIEALRGKYSVSSRDDHIYHNTMRRRTHEDMTPEELFSALFGDIDRINRQRPMFQQFRRARRHSAQENMPLLPMFLQLFPLLLIFILSIFNSMFSNNYPSFSFYKTHQMNQEYRTFRYDIPYYMNSHIFKSHFDGKESARQVFERGIEDSYISNLQTKCQRELTEKNANIANARWAGSTDRLKQAESMQLPSCEKLHTFRYNNK